MDSRQNRREEGFSSAAVHSATEKAVWEAALRKNAHSLLASRRDSKRLHDADRIERAEKAFSQCSSKRAAREDSKATDRRNAPTE